MFEFPDIEELTNLTDDEKRRIKFDHHYRYYYDRYKDDKRIEELLRRVFGDLFSDEFIEYALPLILNEPCIKYENGLPKFAKLEKHLIKF